ncbi:hypothetical protein AYI68_g2115 [Smittium mucronatum]|uniref:Uncharacterized protein n=1 Tax=Smittium mucronatum TaxID=133383 RepID=A0A1R0H3M2_9FUNG|nr:hypothetical protein AYI68_g2115 [Smittium mucronatum]
MFLRAYNSNLSNCLSTEYSKNVSILLMASSVSIPSPISSSTNSVNNLVTLRTPSVDAFMMASINFNGKKPKHSTTNSYARCGGGYVSLNRLWTPSFPFFAVLPKSLISPSSPTLRFFRSILPIFTIFLLSSRTFLFVHLK